MTMINTYFDDDIAEYPLKINRQRRLFFTKKLMTPITKSNKNPRATPMIIIAIKRRRKKNQRARERKIVGLIVHILYTSDQCIWMGALTKVEFL